MYSGGSCPGHDLRGPGHHRDGMWWGNRPGKQKLLQAQTCPCCPRTGRWLMRGGVLILLRWREEGAGGSGLAWLLCPCGHLVASLAITPA